jgi:hypothetical protein
MLGEFGTTQALIVATNEATIRQDDAEHHKTREYFAANQDAAESRRDHEAQMKQFLGSLADEEMNARRNQIQRSHTDTFSWVFDKNSQQPWDSFPDWVSSDDSLYWISGKAGSGKSTLMKFLIMDQRTREYLDEWAPGCAIYSHFIWNSGTRIQRSILGLLRSLLYQILEDNQQILDNVLQKWLKVSKIKNADDWSRDTLEEVLLYSLSLHEKGVCIFVDGLDEIDLEDGPFDILSLVKQISSPAENKGFKVCVSSRPETSFKRGLERYPKLRLQDLTRGDMKMYATHFLRTKCAFHLSGIHEKLFIGEIVTKSGGVFLWVSLALKSLQRGFINGDDPSTLMKRLRTLPSELGKLYEDMIKRLGDDQDLYSKEAALIFNIFIFFSENSYRSETGWWNLFHYVVAFDQTLRDIILNPKCLPSPESLKKALLDIDRKLASRCAGILEVVNLEGTNAQTRLNSEYFHSKHKTRPWASIGIEFIHRSAKEFLLSMKHKLLDQDITTAAERKSRVLQAIALEDLYWVDGRGFHGTDQNTAMYIMTETEPRLPDKEELKVLNLIQEVYQRNRWTEFYGIAARYAFYQPHAHLLESCPQYFKPLLNYFLLCALTGHTKGIHKTASYFLDMGANPNYVAFLPVLQEARHDNPTELYLFLPTPLLGFILEEEYFGFSHLLLEEMIHLFLAFGADVERKFLSIKIRGRPKSTGKTSLAGPVYNVTCCGEKGRFDFLVETNCVYLIMDELVQRRSVPHSELLEIVKLLGLNKARAHHKALLCFRGDTVYGVNDEDSSVMNEFWDWNLSRMPKGDNAESKEDDRDAVGSDESDDSDGINDHGCNDDNDSCDSEYDLPEDKKRFERSYKLLKGNEVHDVKEWLSNRGYTLPEEKEFSQSFQASIHEVVAIYQMLNERFGFDKNVSSS